MFFIVCSWDYEEEVVLQFCLNWGMWDKTCNMFTPLVYFFKDSRPVLTSLRLRLLYVWEETVC